jgi:NADPH:quinone reductase-like Zn-dependent oxidoreductase
MKAAIVLEAGKTPVFGDFQEPTPVPGEEKITVIASALSNFAKLNASAYTKRESGQYPFIAGIDGVGRTQNGRRVYFINPRAPFGAIAETVVVNSSQCITLPEGVDDIMAAAIANPGSSSWIAFKERARLEMGENVLINGATGIAGKLAVQIAKHLGAKKVIATGRNAAALEETKSLGADVTISLLLKPDELEKTFKEQIGGDGVDVVIDYLWGEYAEILMSAISKEGKKTKDIRYVGIGSIKDNITLSGWALRSAPLVVMGSGFTTLPFQKSLAAINNVMMSVESAKLKIKTQKVPFSKVEEFWNNPNDHSRMVFTVTE